MSTAPNGTTDAPTRDSIPSGTEADDPIPGIAKRLAERLRLALFPGIKAFEKKTLATFNWEDQGKRHSTSVVLQDVKDPRAGAATVNFTLVWQAKGGKEVEVPIKAAFNVQIQRARAALLLQIYVHEGSRTVTLARSENIAKWDAGEKNVVFYPYPSSAIGVERVGQVWFPKDPSQKAISREIGFTGSSTQTILSPFWPHFNESNGWVVELPPLPSPLGEAMSKDVPEGWGKTVLSIAIWASLVQPFQQAESGQSEAVVDPTVFGLPPVAKYWPQRAVNLDPNRVYAELSKTLLLPWHLVAAACASLNAGKHVIFTGPPGCGKSKLAIAFAQIVRNAEPVISTASPAWTAGDLVGRYLPRRDGKGLEFKPGFFLRAVEANRCLVIDEFNRANIDQCFGELFAVFAGDPVELPFEQAIEEVASTAALPTSTGRDDGSSQDGAGLSGGAVGEATAIVREPRYATVRILPTIYTRRQGTRPESEGVVYRDYKVSPEFRLIGTMNDADRAQLHQLSFALLRRFDILRVEAPAPDRVKEFVAERVGKIADSIDKTAYQFEGQGTRELLNRLRVDYLEPLFANVLPKQDPSGVPFADLVVERVIGLATVEDILRFLAEGLRCPNEGEKVQTSGLKEAGLAAAVSYLAMGLVLSVFPQLDALDRARRWVAIAHVIKIFHRDGKGSPFVHIEGKRDEKVGRVSYHLVKPSARSFRPKDIDKNNEISTAEYLIGELSLQYQDIGDEIWNELVRGA